MELKFVKIFLNFINHISEHEIQIINMHAFIKKCDFLYSLLSIDNFNFIYKIVQ